MAIQTVDATFSVCCVALSSVRCISFHPACAFVETKFSLCCFFLPPSSFFLPNPQHSVLLFTKHPLSKIELQKSKT